MSKSMAGMYELLTHMFHNGKQHAPGAVIDLPHEDAVLGLEQKTIKPATLEPKISENEAVVRRTPNASISDEIVAADTVKTDLYAKAAEESAVHPPYVPTTQSKSERPRASR